MIMNDDESLLWTEVQDLEERDEVIFNIKKVRSRSHDGATGTFIKVSPPNWVTVIPELEEEKFLIVRQYRHGSAALSDEFPAGVIDTGETPLEAAVRELREETGYEAREMLPIGSINPNPAFMTNLSYTFLARGLNKCYEQDLDEHERIKTFIVDRKSISENMGKGKFNSAIMVQAWFWYERLEKH